MTADGAYILFQCFAGLLGLLFGSFMNVCIARIPEERSVAWPGSACPSCNTPIKPYDNVPVLAWLWLRGRCRACSAAISPLYPLVEAAFGVLMVLLFRRVVPDLADFNAPHLAAFLWYGWLLFATMAMGFIDIRHKIIPDEFSIYSVPVGVLGAAGLHWLGYTDGPTWQQSVVGAMAGGGFFAALVKAADWWYGFEAMGWGDAKLMAAYGAWFGAFPGLVVIMLVGSMSAAVVGVVLAWATGKSLKLAIPFGPFLGAGAVVFLFFGEHITLRFFG